LFSAEQTLLLVRLAADSGARRGELAALRHSDLDGRILSIERGLSVAGVASASSGVAAHLVDEGKFLKAQARLGHRDGCVPDLV